MVSRFRFIFCKTEDAVGKKNKAERTPNEFKESIPCKPHSHQSGALFLLCHTWNNILHALFAKACEEFKDLLTRKVKARPVRKTLPANVTQMAEAVCGKEADTRPISK
jgi:hypothetical protein